MRMLQKPSVVYHGSDSSSNFSGVSMDWCLKNRTLLVDSGDRLRNF